MAGQFRVLSQRQSIELTADSRFQDVMEVTYESIPSGATGTERFLLRDYTPERVSQVLSERAAALEAIAGL